MNQKILTGVAVAGIGAIMALIGADIIPQRLWPPNVPGWLLAALGLGLVLAGVSVFFRIGSPRATRMVGVALLSMSLTFGWVSLFGDARHMSGGIPFLPDAVNVFIGRLAFGFVALFFLWLSIMALKYARFQPEEGVEEDER
jgi:hypothetical protein